MWVDSVTRGCIQIKTRTMKTKKYGRNKKKYCVFLLLKFNNVLFRLIMNSFVFVNEIIDCKDKSAIIVYCNRKTETIFYFIFQTVQIEMGNGKKRLAWKWRLINWNELIHLKMGKEENILGNCIDIKAIIHPMYVNLFLCLPFFSLFLRFLISINIKIFCFDIHISTENIHQFILSNFVESIFIICSNIQVVKW